MRSRLKTYSRKLFFPTPKIWRGKPQIFEDRRQSGAHNFETAQHVDKRITDTSSGTYGTKLRAIIQKVMQLEENYK